MKKCPQCGRDYTDDTLSFCLDDGSNLLDGPWSMDGPATAILPDGASTAEPATRILDPAVSEATKLYGEKTKDSSPGTTSKKATVIASVVGVLLLSALGIGGYLYYGGGTNQIESIAVIPFVNESGDEDVEYLSDGMTDTLINSLSQVPNLKVKASSLVFRYKGKVIDPKAVSSELNVQAILTGRVVQRGDRLTLSLELIDGETENTVWGNKYERKRSDLVSLQSEVARDVSSKLRRKLSGADIAKVEKSYTANAEAYQLYLRGKFSWNKRTGESLKKANEFYNQAIEKDPSYALAYAGLAETYVLFSSYDVAPAKDSMPQAKAAALRALEIDESLAEAHTALGFYLSVYEWDRIGAEKEYRRAIELKPEYATAHQWYGGALRNVKRFEESIAEYRRAESLDPLSSIIGTNLGDVLVCARKYDEAIVQYKRTLIRNPGFSNAHRGLGQTYGLTGRYTDAIAETREAIELREGTLAKGYLGMWLARSGKREEALKLLGELEEESTRNYVQGFTFALVYIGLGDKEKALDRLEEHMLSRAESASMYAVFPELDDLSSEPRFKAMLKRLNLPE